MFDGRVEGVHPCMLPGSHAAVNSDWVPSRAGTNLQGQEAGLCALSGRLGHGHDRLFAVMFHVAASTGVRTSRSPSRGTVDGCSGCRVTNAGPSPARGNGVELYCS
jgi:hypothetical protein